MICHGRMDSYGQVDFSGMSASERVWAGRWLDVQSIDLDQLERRSARIMAFGPTEFSIGFGQGAWHLATHPWEIVPVMTAYKAVFDPEQSKEDFSNAGKALIRQPARTGGNMAGNAVVAAPFAWAGVKALGMAVDYTGLRIPASAGVATARSPIWSSATGDVVVNGANLPGSAGVQIARRLTTTEMEALTQTHGVEFSLLYRTGPGPNGAGGTYWLHSGTITTVDVPIGSNIRWISHTHPGGTPYASGMTGDQGVLQALQAAGSPQQSSVIVPVGGQPFRFNLQNKRVP